MNAKERFNKLSELGCVVCRVFHGVHTPPQMHHLQGLKYRALGKKADDLNSIPLCVYHHTGGHKDILSVHGNPKLFKEHYGTQEELLEMTNKLLEKMC